MKPESKWFRTASSMLRAGHGTRDGKERRGVTARLLTIWIASTLIVATGAMYTSSADAAPAPATDGCWLFNGWLEEGDGWCELNTPGGQKYCGKCVYDANFYPYDLYYESCFGSLDHCIWADEEEDCPLPVEACETSFIPYCAGLDTCLGR